jgi:hypothetical protein
MSKLENKLKREDESLDPFEKPHHYAFDSNGNWVDARKTVYKKYQSFSCGCPGRHEMKLVKPSGKPEKRPFCDYFAHKSQTTKRHKNDTQNTPAISKCGGGESWKHIMAKHTLREHAGSYYFTTFRCNVCFHESIYDSNGCSVSMEVTSNDKQWRYDCLLKKNNLAAVAMEIVHTHLTGSTKVNSVRESGIELVEFRADDVIEAITNLKEGQVKLENIKIRSGVCDTCCLMTQFNTEISEQLKLENIIRLEYEKREEIKRLLNEEMEKRKEKERIQRNIQLSEEEKRLEQEALIKNSIKCCKQLNHEELVISPKQPNLKSQNTSAYDPPKCVYRSVYHPPNGRPSWTPYEMIADRV